MEKQKEIAKNLYLFHMFRDLAVEMSKFYLLRPQLLNPEVQEAFSNICLMEINAFQRFFDHCHTEIKIGSENFPQIPQPSPNASINEHQALKIQLKALMYLLKKCKNDIKKTEQSLSFLFAARADLREIYHELEEEYKNSKPPVASRGFEQKNTPYFNQGMYTQNL